MNDKDQKQNSVETEPSVDIHDRVAEAYYGLMGQQFMRDTQARIHWICRQIQGKSVLDVGCSQGIVPILLAREGLKAIGIDSSPQGNRRGRPSISQTSRSRCESMCHLSTQISFHGIMMM